ncbi:hypothetical protein FS837_011807 [Tulasnella sp. UAMH 9824]|nr:hypothetical protein FS837_011807 [Tulasnella sp. UAMH 9824]
MAEWFLDHCHAASQAQIAGGQNDDAAGETLPTLDDFRLIENTGGSAAYIKHLEEAQPANTEKAPQIDPKQASNRIFSAAEITIERGQPKPGHFILRINTKAPAGVGGAPTYVGEGYSYGPTVTASSFSGSLSLYLPGGWEGLVGAKDVTFGWVKSSRDDLMDWEVYIDGTAVMSFSGVALRDEALVGKGGPMYWKKRVPYPRPGVYY